MLACDLDFQPDPSRRTCVVARRGAVASTQPRAVQAGLRMLEAGGSAADAAVATAAVLTVVEPMSTGLGGDAFALIWDGTRLHGLNGSGRAPRSLDADTLRAAGHDKIPNEGWASCTVPGAVQAWQDLHQRFGRLDFETVLAPAMDAACDGFTVTPHISGQWQKVHKRLSCSSDPALAPFAKSFLLPDGRAPQPGEIFTNASLGHTLTTIARQGARSMYEGALADQIIAHARNTGGFFTHEDLASHHSEWVAPISACYRGFDVWEIPPNGQGLTALLALKLLEGFDLPAMDRSDPQRWHLGAQAMKLAFADAARYIADPAFADVPLEGLLSSAYADERRREITDQASVADAGNPPGGDTVYLCATDDQGMMVSFIQSTYMGFGSGVTVPDTGIYLQNRGANFTLDAGHRNCLAPGKRPYHTIIPGFLTRGGQAVGPFGVMGGFMQPQGHVQMVLNTVDWHLNPQASLDAPRWQVFSGNRLAIEAADDSALAAALRQRGHQVQASAMGCGFGRGQIIWRTATGGYIAGSDPRGDSLALGLD